MDDFQKPEDLFKTPDDFFKNIKKTIPNFGKNLNASNSLRFNNFVSNSNKLIIVIMYKQGAINNF